MTEPYYAEVGQGWHNLPLIPVGVCFLFGGPPESNRPWREAIRPIGGYRPATPDSAADVWAMWIWWSVAVSWGYCT